MYTGDGAFEGDKSPLRLWLKSSESRVTPGRSRVAREQSPRVAVEISEHAYNDGHTFTNVPSARPLLLPSHATGWVYDVTREP